MKLPRNISGDDLTKKLKKFGYVISRQTGSHIRLTKTGEEGEHHITIPKHRYLKIGTLNSIVKDLADHFRVSRDELIEKMWG